MAPRPLWCLLLQCFLAAQLCSPFVFTASGGTRSPFVLTRHTASEARENSLYGGGSGDDSLPDETTENAARPSIHPTTIDAIAEALKVRAQNKTTMPLRYSKEVEPVEITMTAGKIAQDAIARRVRAAQKDGMIPLTDVEKQTIGGRILAVVVRFDELEPELRSRCQRVEGIDERAADGGWDSFGALEDESDVAALDERILKDDAFGQRRAECLLALFIELIEGPGLRRNGVTVPCMDADFLGADRHEALFGEVQQREEKRRAMDELQDALAEVEAKEKESASPNGGTSEEIEVSDRPSLHPVTIDAIVEALRIRAENKTTSPLRFDESGTVEMLDIQLTSRKIAERAVKAARDDSTNGESATFTEEEEAAVACRIQAVACRMDDLEWELVHRCSRRRWISERNEHDAFGILKDESCVRTLDERILADADFARKRAERLLALFLLNLEGPGVRAAGDSMPGGSEPDYLEEEHYNIMMPQK